MKKLIIFDMGDTLVHNLNMNFDKSLQLVHNKYFSNQIDINLFLNYSIELLNDIFKERTAIEFKMIDYLRQIIDYFGLNINVSIDEIEEYFGLNSCEIEIIDDVINLLDYFKKKNYQLILLSNTSFSKNVVTKMLNGLEKYFSYIFVSSEYPFRKPSNYFFDIAISKSNNISKNDIYYIGNSLYYDVYGSNNAGIKSIWFNENKIINVDYKHSTYLEINNYKELIDMEF